MELSPDTIKKVLQNVKYPGFTRDIVSFGLVKDVQIDGAKVNVSLVLGQRVQDVYIKNTKQYQQFS